MNAVGKVSALWRYPASSLGGEAVARVDVREQGVQGDRLFGLVERATGEIARPDRGAKWHSVPRIAARLAGDELEIMVPGGDWLPAPGAGADAAASAFLGFDVSIRRFDGQDFMPRYVAAPVHLLTTASLARLKALHPAGRPDPRRFRPNLVIEMPEAEGAFPESAWIGRRLRIGDCELTISDHCRRCGFTVIAQADFDNDPDILRTLVRHNAHNIGVYCTVDRPSRISIGDTFALL